jgi:glutathione S-transferase
VRAGTAPVTAYNDARHSVRSTSRSTRELKETPPVRIIGSYLSPYVRKVLVCLDLKGIAYRIDPIVPFFGNDEFTRISPVRRVPILIDERVTLPDSTVICEYLDERFPDPPLLPGRVEDRARARWLEEYADSRMGEVFIWRLFDQLVIGPAVWGRAPDEAVLRKTREEEIPEILDRLEVELPERGFLFDSIGLADIALASFFRNAAFAGFTVDAERWPRTERFVSRALSHPSFAKLRPFEEVLLRTPIARHREALGGLGAPLTATSLGEPAPRRGVLRT